MNEEERSVIQEALELGKLIGTYGNSMQIKIFEYIIEDWSKKNEQVDKIQKENRELRKELQHYKDNIIEDLENRDRWE